MGVFTLSRMCSGSNAKFDRLIVKVPVLLWGTVCCATPGFAAIQASAKSIATANVRMTTTCIGAHTTIGNAQRVLYVVTLVPSWGKVLCA